MKSNAITSVSFHLIVEMVGVQYVLCQRRGYWNFEHSPPKPESWPGGLQPLVHGKMQEGESPLETLMREMREEIGREFRGRTEFKEVNGVAHFTMNVDGTRIIQFHSTASIIRWIAVGHIGRLRPGRRSENTAKERSGDWTRNVF